MRISSLLGLLATLVAVNGQNVRELTIYDSSTTINDFHLEAGETLHLTFMTDPHTLMFFSSTLFRIPTGTFSRDTLNTFFANSASINALTEDDFFNAVNLEVLQLGGNNISQLPANLFRYAPKLNFIQLSNCGITTVDASTFEGLSELRVLQMTHNNIATLPVNVFAPLTNLGSIYLTNNGLTDLRFANFGSAPLDQLRLENNNIVTINEGDILASNLVNLYLFLNKIEKLNNNIFRNTPQLKQINMFGNNITEIEEDAFVGLDNLDYLSLFLNNIDSLPSRVFLPLRQLTYMDLSDNQINEINFGHFSNQPYLSTLNLESNNLKELDLRTFVALKSLRQLHLHNNNLETLDMSDIGFLMPNLYSIGLNNNDFYCSSVARMVANMRKFNITLYKTFEPISDKVILDDIACYESSPVQLTQKKLLS